MPDRTAPDDQPIILERLAPLHIISNTPKGRGVFAGRTIRSGTIVETCPVLLLDPKENAEHIEKTALYHYTYNWPITNENGKPLKTQAVVFGLGSMFNHSTQNQNVGWQRDLSNQLVIYRALRDIQEGEELCISYGDHLTFVDADKPHENAVVENGDDVLSRIQLNGLT